MANRHAPCKNRHLAVTSEGDTPGAHPRSIAANERRYCELTNDLLPGFPSVGACRRLACRTFLFKRHPVHCPFKDPFSLPPIRDFAERVQNASQVVATLRQAIGHRRRDRLRLFPPYHPGAFEHPQAFGEHSRRYPRHGASQPSESLRPCVTQNPDDVGRPRPHEQTQDRVHRALWRRLGRYVTLIGLRPGSSPWSIWEGRSST